jgi:hypothetical protein
MPQHVRPIPPDAIVAAHVSLVEGRRVESPPALRDVGERAPGFWRALVQRRADFEPAASSASV